MALGFDKPLYILPFDHRGSFQTGLFGWKGALTPQQHAEVCAAKKVVYDGFLAALAAGVDKSKAGILVDEQFGGEVLADAVAKGYSVSCPAEKSGQDEFDFEYGEDFGAHVEKVDPTFCKVLVRLNPEGNQEENARQTARLKRLSDWLKSKGRMFMYELLVPATAEQLKKFGHDGSDDKDKKKAATKRYDLELRPQLMVRCIQEQQDAGIEADVWKIEGLDEQKECAKVVAAARRGGRDKVGCIILGRGESDEKVGLWLTTAAKTPGFIGFAVGRTSFWTPLVMWRDDRSKRDDAVKAIAHNYRTWCDTFDKARASG